MTLPNPSPPPSAQPLYAPLAPAPAPAKFSGLARASLILGIVGVVVFSFVPILDLLTMLGALVGIGLGGIALFGSRKRLAGIGTGLCVLAVVFTAGALPSATVDKAAIPAPSPVAPQAPAAGSPAAAAPNPAQQGAAGPDNPAAQHAEATFLGDLHTAGVPLTTQSTINGYAVCLVMKTGASRDSAVTQAASAMHLTGQQAVDLVTAANSDLCQRIE